MITRIVKLHLHDNNIGEFIAIYNQSKAFIETSKGNQSVHLHRDSLHANILFTVSKWDSEDDLNNYRSSDFFSEVWTKIKPLLLSKTEAWSLYEIK